MENNNSYVCPVCKGEYQTTAPKGNVRGICDAEKHARQCVKPKLVVGMQLFDGTVITSLKADYFTHKTANGEKAINGRDFYYFIKELPTTETAQTDETQKVSPLVLTYMVSTEASDLRGRKKLAFWNIINDKSLLTVIKELAKRKRGMGSTGFKWDGRQWYIQAGAENTLAESIGMPIEFVARA